MFRRTVAALLLALIGVGFFSWSQVKKDTINTINYLVDQIHISALAGQKEQAKENLEELKKVIDEKREIFNLVYDHEFMATLTNHISEIEISINHWDSLTLQTSIAHFRNTLNDFYEDNQIRFENII